MTAWSRFLGALGSPAGLVAVLLLLAGTLFFALRWLRVGAKIPSVRLGPLPAPGVVLVQLGHFAGFAVVTAALVVLLSGLVL